MRACYLLCVRAVWLDSTKHIHTQHHHRKAVGLPTYRAGGSATACCAKRIVCTQTCAAAAKLATDMCHQNVLSASQASMHGFSADDVNKMRLCVLCWCSLLAGSSFQVEAGSGHYRT